jgi:glucose/mannose-6-phosphate isomerase
MHSSLPKTARVFSVWFKKSKIKYKCAHTVMAGKCLQPSVLDKTDAMQKIDKSNMIGFCVEAANHYRESAKNTQRIKFAYSMPKNVVIAGMGGSAIGGELLKDYARDKSQVPIEVSREYKLPAYADKNTLVILASYSGDTEETLSSFLDAVKRKCMVYCISSGGSLIEYAQKLGVPYLQVKAGMPPRAALPHMFLPLLKSMEKINALPKLSDEFSEITKVLEAISSQNSPEKPSEQNFAKKLALNLNKTVPVVYGFGVYRGVALRFKQQFNENAKVPAKWENFSELNHNETMGWENSQGLAKYYALVFIRDKVEPVEIRSRIETTKGLMQPKMSKLFEVWAEGKGELSKMLSTILVGDFTSVYLAFLRNVDPTPVDTVSVMKEKIELNGVKKKIISELEKMAAK